MRIIEQFVAAKRRGLPSEDIVVLTEDFVAIFDGETQKPGTRSGHMSPGRLAALKLKEALENLPAVVPIHEAVELLSASLRTLKTPQTDSTMTVPSASALIYSAYRSEIWRIGSAQFLIDGVPFVASSMLDSSAAGVRSAYLRCMLLQGHEVDSLRHHDLGREVILPLLAEQHTLRNRPIDMTFSYAALDGGFVPRAFQETFFVGPNIRELVLASDGYPKIFESLDVSEEYLREVIRTDPLLIDQHRSTKGVEVGADSYDDRAYVRILL